MRNAKWNYVFPRLLASVIFTSISLSRSDAAPNHTKIVKNSNKSDFELAENYSLPKIGTLSARDLYLFALKKLHYQKKDQFDPDFDDASILGRKFRVELKFSDTPLSAGPQWNYNPDKQELRLTQRNSAWSAFDFLILNSHTTYKNIMENFINNVGLPTGINIYSNTTKSPDSIMQNSFGAKVKVSSSFTESVYFGGFRKTGGGELWNDLGDNQSGYDYSMSIDPASARKLVGGLTEIIEGEVIPTGDGQAIICGGYYHEATLSRPHEFSGTNCVISTRFKSVVFYSTDRGVVASWPQN